MYQDIKKREHRSRFFMVRSLFFHSFQKRRQIVAGLRKTILEAVFVVDQMERAQGVLAEADDVGCGNQAVAPSVDDFDGIARTTQPVWRIARDIDGRCQQEQALDGNRCAGSHGNPSAHAGADQIICRSLAAGIHEHADTDFRVGSR